MIAAKNNHQQILPLHFLASLLADENGVITNIINMVGGDLRSINTKCEEELSRIPRVNIMSYLVFGA